jgi:hypothetical protein
LEPDHQERLHFESAAKKKQLPVVFIENVAKKKQLPVVFIGKLGISTAYVKQVARPKWHPFADDICAPVSGKGSFDNNARQIRE